MDQGVASEVNVGLRNPPVPDHHLPRKAPVLTDMVGHVFSHGARMKDGEAFVRGFPVLHLDGAGIALHA